MHKIYVKTDNLNTISECLQQLFLAEQVQLSIEDQLANSKSSSDWSAWRKKAENALRVVKAKRRVITARLAILRQEEKEHTLQFHQQRNDYLIQELKNIVTPSSFERCVRQANGKMEAAVEQGI
ncbi:hypothetical protein R4P48_21465 [Atlantibacter subterranea]|uniref:Uncharacterized protein n=1 Tax=Atlantibacter subterraneus TaxID=255519 RepID=A0ABU4E7W1_9ENTR|nr:hypothetical protein [Atlantibacter subterranea]MDV7025229.1 hypothetical protein [Atlantibacter subterranea]MDZ5668367.1 hypothetical protein [Atlantibacter hermannii]